MQGNISKENIINKMIGKKQICKSSSEQLIYNNNCNSYNQKN